MRVRQRLSRAALARMADSLCAAPLAAQSCDTRTPLARRTAWVVAAMSSRELAALHLPWVFPAALSPRAVSLPHPAREVSARFVPAGLLGLLNVSGRFGLLLLRPRCEVIPAVGWWCGHRGEVHNDGLGAFIAPGMRSCDVVNMTTSAACRLMTTTALSDQRRRS